MTAEEQRKPVVNVKRMQHFMKVSASIVIMTFALVGCGSSTTALEPVRFSTWNAQVALAKAAIQKVDANSVLMWISSMPISCGPKDAQPAVITFVFVNPAGVRRSVEIADTDPPSVKNGASEFDRSSVPFDTKILERFATAASSIVISPRQACEKTLNDGEAYAGVATVGMFLDRNQQSNFGIPAVWSVWYDDHLRGTSMNFLVSPTTGEILKRTVESDEVEQTPLATP